MTGAELTALGIVGAIIWLGLLVAVVKAPPRDLL